MIKNCLARIGCLALVLAVVGGAWLFREDIATWWSRLDIGASSQPSEVLAQRAERKFLHLREGTGSAAVVFSQEELQSLLTYRVAPLLLQGVHEPVIEIRDTSVLLSARLVAEELDQVAPPEMLRQFLADSTQVTVELLPRVLTAGVAEIRVAGVKAGAVVVPPMMIPWLIGSLELEGIQTAGSLLLVPIPPGVGHITVTPGQLQLSDGT